MSGNSVHNYDKHQNREGNVSETVVWLLVVLT